MISSLLDEGKEVPVCFPSQAVCLPPQEACQWFYNIQVFVILFCSQWKLPSYSDAWRAAQPPSCTAIVQYLVSVCKGSVEFFWGRNSAEKLWCFVGAFARQTHKGIGMLKTHARYPCVCTHSTQSFLLIYRHQKTWQRFWWMKGRLFWGLVCGVCVWARRRGFMGARQLFFCDLCYRVAFWCVFALKFDLIRKNHEVNATFSANFCLNGCFCWKSMQLFLHFSRKTVVYGGGAVTWVKRLPRILFGLQ